MSYINRTVSYLKRNGIKNTYYAIMERIDQKGMDSKQRQAKLYHKPFAADINGDINLEDLENSEMKDAIVFSILVPTYETDERFLREMTDSVLNQSYPHLQLVIADASKSDQVEKVIQTYADDRICYVSVKENTGISANTNVALDHATGDYIGLLDHDDILEKNALFEIMKCLKGHDYDMIYTDEDKMSEDGQVWFEPNFKPDFNLDYLLSNNYICHFTVMKSELMKKLRFRPEFDGAQDYDLFLRAVLEIEIQNGTTKELQEGRLFCDSYMKDKIGHVSKILYHWRAHGGSTADNPESKRYAYEAGRNALTDFLKETGWKAVVNHTKHLGFYKISYVPDLFTVRTDVAAVCGRVISHGRVVEGPVLAGENLFCGMHEKYSGYMHRANMLLDVDSAPESCTHHKGQAKSDLKNGRIVYLPDYIVRK